MNSSQSKRLGAFKIALVFFSFSAMYIVFSDFLVIHTSGKFVSRETLTNIQLYKGLVFVFIASVVLYILIQREMKAANSSIHRLKIQNEKFRNLSLEKEKIEKRLQRRNSFIETILNHLPVGIAVNRKGETKAVRVNKQFAEIYGWPGEEINEISAFFEKVYADPQYRTQIKERVLNDIASNNPDNMRWEGVQITTKHGEKRIVDARNIPVPNQNWMISTVQDVTEKYESENRLKESEIKFSSLFKLNPVATVFTRFHDGAILEVNDAYCKLFGYSNEELMSHDVKSPQIWKNPNDRKKVLEILERENAVHGYEAQAVCKDGKVIEALSYLQLVEITGEKAIISITLDITEQKKNEQQLKESEQKFRAIFENSLTPIAIADDSGKFLAVNKASEDVFGYSKTELLQMKINDLPSAMPGDATERYREYLKKKQEKGEFNFISKTEEEHTVMYQAIRIAEDFNLSVMMDITPRIQAEKNLEESKNLLEKTLNNLNEAVLVADQNRNIMMANAPVENIFGYKPGEITGKSTAFLHMNEEAFRKLGEQGRPVLEKTGIYRTTYPMQRKDGTTIETEITTTVIEEEDGWQSGIISVIRDITERVENEKKLQQYQQTLQQLTTELSLAEEKQRKEIAANIHDHLSQLLVISKIRLSELSGRLQSEQDKENLSVVTNYISEALENSRKITYDLSPPVLYEMGLVETMHWLTEKISEEQGTDITFTSEQEKIDLPDSKLILVYRSIQELISNALKHARADHLEIKFERKDMELIVTVTDDGKGFVVDGLSAVQFKKGGFGLFAVRERVNNLGGKFEINSRPGFGTTVEFSVPLT